MIALGEPFSWMPLRYHSWNLNELHVCNCWPKLANSNEWEKYSVVIPNVVSLKMSNFNICHAYCCYKFFLVTQNLEHYIWHCTLYWSHWLYLKNYCDQLSTMKCVHTQMILSGRHSRKRKFSQDSYPSRWDWFTCKEYSWEYKIALLMLNSKYLQNFSLKLSWKNKACWWDAKNQFIGYNC